MTSALVLLSLTISVCITISSAALSVSVATHPRCLGSSEEQQIYHIPQLSAAFRAFAPQTGQPTDLLYVPAPNAPKSCWEAKPFPRLGAFTMSIKDHKNDKGIPNGMAAAAKEYCKDRSNPGAHINPKKCKPHFVFLSKEVPILRPAWYPSMPAVTYETHNASAVGVLTYEIPFASYRAFDANLTVAPSLASRRKLVAYFGNTIKAGEDPTHMIGRSPLRTMLVSECQKNPANCTTDPGASAKERISFKNDRFMEAYGRAVFCLQPWGDTSLRKGYWDSVASGCIPVVFESRGIESLASWFGDYREWTLLVPIAEVRRGVIRYLASVPHDKVRSLYEAVQVARRHVHYRMETRLGDQMAIDLIVKGLGLALRRNWFHPTRSR